MDPPCILFIETGLNCQKFLPLCNCEIKNLLANKKGNWTAISYMISRMQDSKRV